MTELTGKKAEAINTHSQLGWLAGGGRRLAGRQQVCQDLPPPVPIWLVVGWVPTVAEIPKAATSMGVHHVVVC